RPTMIHTMSVHNMSPACTRRGSRVGISATRVSMTARIGVPPRGADSLRGMEILHNLVLLLHFVGFASLFGGDFVQLKAPKRHINAAMFHGALTQLITGLLLVGLLEMGDGDVNHMKIGIKLLVLVVIMVLVVINRKKDAVGDGTFWGIFALTLLNAGIAV